MATALLGYLREAVIFQGTAAQLLPHLCACDPELKDWLTPKRLGKRLSTLWPHLKRNLTEATVTKDGKGFSVYSFRTKTVVLP